MVLQKRWEDQDSTVFCVGEALLTTHHRKKAVRNPLGNAEPHHEFEPDTKDAFRIFLAFHCVSGDLPVPEQAVH